MSDNLEFGESKNNQEQLRERYKQAFESSFSIFRSNQVRHSEFDRDFQDNPIEELYLEVQSTGSDTLSRLHIGRLEASYVGSTAYENGYRDPETIVLATYTPTGEGAESYILQHDIINDDYTMRTEEDETSPLFDPAAPDQHSANNRELLEYKSVVIALSEHLSYPEPL